MIEGQSFLLSSPPQKAECRGLVADNTTKTVELSEGNRVEKIGAS
jgi:hypothetical protein